MAVLKASSRLRVVTLPENRRYRVELRDYERGVTLAFDPDEATTIGKLLISGAAQFDHYAAVKALGDLVDDLAGESDD